MIFRDCMTVLIKVYCPRFRNWINIILIGLGRINLLVSRFWFSIPIIPHSGIRKGYLSWESHDRSDLLFRITPLDQLIRMLIIMKLINFYGNKNNKYQNN